MKNKKTIVASLAAIAMSASLACGATYALFTSESTANIAISSGKVNMTAEIENVKLSYLNNIDSEGNGTEVSGSLYAGTATIDGNKITLEKLVPGDKITLDINVYNESNVASKYQTLIGVSEDNGLFDGLVVTLNGNTYNGKTAKSEWNNEAAVSEKTIVETVSVTIELPWNAGNEYQDKSCELYLSVNAVQGNALCTNPVENTVELYTARDLLQFAKEVNDGNTFAGKTVMLMDDVDLAGIEWKPVGQTTGYSAATYFQGTFDGNGKTISNLTIGESSWEEGSNDGKNFATGFFGFIDMGSTTIKNVTFDKANVEGHHWVGVVAGYMTGTVSDVTVTNSTVTSSYKTSEADGDKAGGIVGYINAGTVSDNTVKNCSVIGNRDIGGIVGAINAGTTFTGNAVSDTEIAYETKMPYGSAGEIVSGRTGFVPDSTNTSSNVKIAQAICTAEQLSAALNATYNSDTTIKLINDITLSGEWGAHTLNATNSAALIIDGNGKTINGLTSTNYYKVNGFNSNGLVTDICPGFSSVTFKNLTVSGAKLTNKGGDIAASGVFVGDTNTVNVTFDSCTVIGAKINSDKYAGGFIGYAQDVNDTKKTITFTNCVVIDSEINTTDSSVGGLVGHNYTGLKINGCRIDGNTTIKCAEDRKGKDAKAGYLIGTVNGGSATISNITVESTVALDTMGGTTYDTTKYVGRNYGTVSEVTVNS